MIAYYENRPQEFRGWIGKKLSCCAHLHQHLELVFFLEGSSVAYADTERFELQPGDVFLSFPKQIHRYESTSHEKYMILVVDPEMIPEFADLFAKSQPTCAVLHGVADEVELRDIMRRLVDLNNPRDIYESAMRRGYLLTLFAKLLPKFEYVGLQSGTSQAFHTVVDYCTQNYTKDLSLSLLEQELHISKYYISHMFSEKLQIGFNDYINSLRVSYACRHLRSSKLSVTEIGSLVGFSTPRTFNRAFLRQMGMTPSDYRKKSRKEK